MVRQGRYRAVVWGLVGALAAALVLAVGPVGAEEDDGLLPSFGDGRLVIAGAGFRPGERVAIVVALDGRTSSFATMADAQGRFRLDTGLAVRPGAAVTIEARGDQGTVKAAITSAPGPAQAPGLPNTGAGGRAAMPLLVAPAAAIAVLLIGTVAGLAARRRWRHGQ